MEKINHNTALSGNHQLKFLYSWYLEVCHYWGLSLLRSVSGEVYHCTGQCWERWDSDIRPWQWPDSDCRLALLPWRGHHKVPGHHSASQFLINYLATLLPLTTPPIPPQWLTLITLIFHSLGKERRVGIKGALHNSLSMQWTKAW